MRQERGMALVITLVVVLTGTIILGAAAVLAHGAGTAAGRWRDEGSALYVAESGLNEALYRLKYQSTQLDLRTYPEDPPSFSGGPGLVGPGSRYDVWVGDDASGSGQRHLVAVGQQGSIRRLVRLTARPLQDSPFSPGGPVGGMAGPTGHPTVPLPGNLECLGILHLTANREYVMGNADGSLAVYRYRGIIADGGCKLILRGPVHIWVTGDPELDPDIYLAGSSRLNVVKSGNQWVGGDPLNLLIWVPGAISIDIDLLGNTQFYGGIWAPYSSLTISGNATMVGGLVVDEDRFTADGSSSLEQVYEFYQPMSGVTWPEGTELDWVNQGYN